MLNIPTSPARPQRIEGCVEPVQPHPAAGYGAQTGIPPKSYMVEGILCTLFCCLPFGIVSIINASNVNSAWMAGQYDVAELKSQEAKKWATWGMVAGLIVSALYAVALFAGGLG